MAAYAIKNIDEMEATWGGAFKLARAEPGGEFELAAVEEVARRVLS